MDNQFAPPPLSDAAPVKTSGMAIASLVLGILGVFSCGVTALVGLVLGIIAMVKVNGSGGKLRGFGFALAGTILSGIFLLAIPIYAAMLLPALAAAKQKAEAITCVNNEKFLALAVKMYSDDHTNHFPSSAAWCDDVKTYLRSGNVFKCSGDRSGNCCSYAFNTKLDGVDESKINPQTVMLFESDNGWNANGGADLLIGKPRHARVVVVTFADGSVHQLREAQLNALRWDP